LGKLSPDVAATLAEKAKNYNVDCSSGVIDQELFLDLFFEI
jgi:hypothetical protein